MLKIFITFIWLLSTTANSEEAIPPFKEMLSDEAIAMQCELYGNGIASSYATTLLNPNQTYEPKAMATDILAGVMASDQFDMSTRTWREFLPQSNMVYFLVRGIMEGVHLVRDPSVVAQLSTISPDPIIQAEQLNNLGIADCTYTLMLHRETVHGGNADPSKQKVEPIQKTPKVNKEIRT